MQKFLIPTATEQYDYLLLLYFGRKGDPLSRCIARAYRDFNRPMRGFAKCPERERMHTTATELVRSFLSELVKPRGRCSDQPSFDHRHQEACTELCKTYSKAGFTTHAGQAQKWLNMAMKYVFVYGEKHLPGYAPLHRLAHIPLDNIILDQLTTRGLSPREKPWSRMGYDEYMNVQNWVREWVRNTHPDSSPLAVEFRLFQNPDVSIDEDNDE